MKSPIIFSFVSNPESAPNIRHVIVPYGSGRPIATVEFWGRDGEAFKPELEEFFETAFRAITFMEATEGHKPVPLPVKPSGDYPYDIHFQLLETKIHQLQIEVKLLKSGYYESIKP